MMIVLQYVNTMKIVFKYLDDNRRSTETIANIMKARKMANVFGDDEPVTTPYTPGLETM